ncbi:MAG: 4Fe-4S dicluster domain-containing protein [Chloroflexi bacterium]|nr:4Fe-4S dicluster domain-containing protein [Chloroflexota bacterium]
MSVSRREFLKTAAKYTAGLAALVSAPKWLPFGRRDSSIAQAAPAAAGSNYDWDQHTWGFVVDTTACIGCGKCAVACKTENNVPMEPEYNRTWVERYVVAQDGQVFADSPNGGIDGFDTEQANAKYRNLQIRDSFFVPKLCNQCENAPCVQVCPVGATYRTKDGVVLIDRDRCIGCRYCIQACPYGARFLDPRMRVADKCTWCYHRITKGLNPACVEACPVGARVFGDMRDSNSRVRKLLAEKRVNVLKPALGTKPQVFYIGLQEGVR